LGERTGVLIAIVSSSLGGTAAAVTRYLVQDADPLTLAILRWGVGFLCVLPVALMLRVQWPKRSDWPAVAALGIAFFGLFFIFYNIAVGYTTAARASLALSTLPLQTMLVGPPRRRAVDGAQVGRGRHRHHGGVCRACVRSGRCAGGSVAR
jgi:drug/metabolite transporter (DMT)-like permease